MYCSGCREKKRLRYPTYKSDPSWCTQSCAARWADIQLELGNSDASNNCCGMNGGDCHEDWCKGYACGLNRFEWEQLSEKEQDELVEKAMAEYRGY